MILSLLFSTQLMFSTTDTSALKRIDIPVLHPRTREWAYPVQNVKVPDNTTCLLWPGAAGKDIQYKVVLAADSLFKTNVISGPVQKWAVFPVHQKLKEGKWFWKYAYRNGGDDQAWQWSERYSFLAVPGDDKIAVSPEVTKVLEKLNDGHPRLWSLNKISGQFYTNNKNNPEAQAFIASTRKLLGKPLPEEKPTRPRDTTGMTELERKQMVEFMYHGFGNKVAEPIKDLVTAYLLSHEKVFLNEAIKQGLHVAKMNPDGLATRDDFNNGNILEGLAWLYDIAYQNLTESDRAVIRKSIQVRGTRIFNHLPNRFELQMCDNHVWQHILRNFSIAAVAVANDIPEANEWFSYVYEVWNARFPVLGSTDGGWHEGNGYFRVHYKTLIYLPLLFGELSGRDYFKEKWMHNLAYYFLYTYPPLSASTSHGDMHENLADIVKNQALFADALSAKIENPYLAWYAASVRKEYPQYFKAKDDFLFFRLLNYKGGKKAAIEKAPNDLPRSRDFRDVGLVAMHSDLENVNRNVTVYLNSNPYGAAGHGHAAQNALTVNYKGKKIFGGSGFYTNFSDAHNLLDYRSARAHNTILADSLGQRIGEDGYGWIPRFISGKRIQYALGDASNAYGNVTTDFWLSRFKQIGINADKSSGYGESGVTLFRRHVLHLDSNYIVVYDELEAARPVKWTTQFHSPYQLKSTSGLKSTEQNFDVTTALGKINARVFSQYPTHLVVHDQYNYPAKNWKGKTDDEGNILAFSKQWHAGITSSPSTVQRFLTIIQLHNQEVQQIKSLSVEAGGIKSLKIGDWTISAQLDHAKPAFLEIKSSDEGTGFSYGKSLIHLKGNNFKHVKAGSSLLVERDGKTYVKREVIDVYPDVMNQDIGIGSK